MPCACQKNRKQYEVVTESGKVVFTSTSQPTADTVAKRYPNSVVRPQGETASTAAK
ncbi:hypothetical protein [Streptomyces sp. NPDC006307]|uniref:hypothetical protein n=1 Tax=Streptomyces sp. NPDC006307 TaxID=3156748 RepID=UPI0033AA85F1